MTAKEPIWMDVETPDRVRKPDATPLKLPPPRLYQVGLTYDDYTRPEFVKIVLQCHFKKSAEDAARIVELQWKNRQNILAGTYPKDTAETIHADTVACAARNRHPLRAWIRPEQC